MAMWGSELCFIEVFAKDLEARPPLPECSQEDLEAHAGQIARLTELLSLAASLPRSSRPPAEAWDEIVGPLFFTLFRKGDDIDRYILADLWRGVLLEEGLLPGYLRASTAVAAALRNSHHLEESLEVFREARGVCQREPSAALANLINSEAVTLELMGDFEAAERDFREALGMAEALGEEDFVEWSMISKASFISREWLNIMDCFVNRARLETGPMKVRFLETAQAHFERLEQMPLGEGHRALLRTNRAELLMAEGRFPEAKVSLLTMVEGGSAPTPLKLSLLPTHARLLSAIACAEGDWEGAYAWVRMAMREGVRHNYPADEHWVLGQVETVLRGMHGAGWARGREELVQELVQLLEDKDWYTGRSHSTGVSNLAVRIGEALAGGGASDGLDLQVLKTAGLLHDIGKLLTPWSLLNKIAPICPKEWVFLREHALRGAEMLRRMGMEQLAPIVEDHHEFLDGTGYPHGRSPGLLAAIVGVSDVFEATTTPNRRYKRPKPERAALAELSAGSGHRYHPAVVSALQSFL